jgi:amidase
MSGFAEYSQHDAVGLAGLVARGEVPAADLVEEAITRAEAVNPQLNSIIDEQYDRARSQARGELPTGPFTGVPFLIKDLAMVAGDRCSFGSVFFRDYRPEVTDEYIKRVLATGVVPIGRTNSPEFGLLPTTEPTLYGPTRNPWNPDFSAGGSSGGAAAAVAAGVVPMAHASDGGGSVRIPAAACGLFGLKPTRGRMPRYPGSPADYLSVDMAVSRSVRDTATLLDAVNGAAPGDRFVAPAPDGSYAAAVAVAPRRLRIAVATTDFRDRKVAPECVAAMEQTASLLNELGHEVIEARPDLDGQALAEAFLLVWGSLAESIFFVILDEAGKRRSGKMLRSLLGDWRAMRLIAWLDGRKAGRPAFEPFTWRLADLSRRSTPAGLEAAKTQLQQVAHTVATFLGDYDLMLSPVLGAPPVRIGAIDQEADWAEVVAQLFDYVAFTPVANFTGLPAMTVPLHWTAGGLPVGSHFTGRFGDEATLLALAGQLEQAAPWAGRRPMVSAEEPGIAGS